MIKHIIFYGSAVWTTTSKENLNRVFRLQKRAARVILDLDMSARTVNMFQQLNWIPFYDEVKILKATTAYKRIKNDSPNYFDDMLKLNSSANSRSTRYCNLNFLNTSKKPKVVVHAVSTIKQWNQLPKTVRDKGTVASFKHSMKQLFKESYENIYHFII